MTLRLPVGFAAGFVLMVVAAGLAACQGTEEDPSQVATEGVTTSPTPLASETSSPPARETPVPRTPGPGETLYRWVNLEVLIPDGSGISASPGVVDYPGKPLHFVIVKVDPEDSRIVSSVVLDSETGAVVEEQILDQDRAEIDRVLGTLSVGPFDRTTAPWPYNGEPTTDLVRKTAGGLSYVDPSSASGLYMGFGIGDPCCLFIDIRNERSVAFVQFKPEGPVYDTSAVHEEDKPVFDRWFAAIKPCDAEMAC